MPNKYKYLVNLFAKGLVFLSALPLTRCNKPWSKTEAAFYYWKSSPYYLSDTEVKYLQYSHVRHLYVKFFEVQSDKIFQAKPVAKQNLRMREYLNYHSVRTDTLLFNALQNIDYIPTVFIENTVLKNLSTTAVDSLADNMWFLIGKYYTEKIGGPTSKFLEIQIDCDWTLGTKENYFRLLTKIRALSKKQISCTLRLYPFRYASKMGIPPVDRVTLMSYNLLNPYEEEARNSILDVDELKNYLKGVESYPLKMDIALPVFSWMLIYQNNILQGMVPATEEIRTHLKPLRPLWNEMDSDMQYGNIYLRKGDKIKLEEITMNQLNKTIELLKTYLPSSEGSRITLFHLDENTLSKYKHENIKHLYTAFSK